MKLYYLDIPINQVWGITEWGKVDHLWLLDKGYKNAYSLCGLKNYDTDNLKHSAQPHCKRCEQIKERKNNSV